MCLSGWWRNRAKWYLFEEDNVPFLHPHHWELEESPPGTFLQDLLASVMKAKRPKKIWELLNTELQFGL